MLRQRDKSRPLSREKSHPPGIIWGKNWAELPSLGGPALAQECCANQKLVSFTPQEASVSSQPASLSRQEPAAPSLACCPPFPHGSAERGCPRSLQHPASSPPPPALQQHTPSGQALPFAQAWLICATLQTGAIGHSPCPAASSAMASTRERPAGLRGQKELLRRFFPRESGLQGPAVLLAPAPTSSFTARHCLLPLGPLSCRLAWHALGRLLSVLCLLSSSVIFCTQKLLP